MIWNNKFHFLFGCIIASTCKYSNWARFTSPFCRASTINGPSATKRDPEFLPKDWGCRANCDVFPMVFPSFSLEPSRSSFSSFENFHAAQTIGLNLVQACGICKWHAVFITPCPSRSLSSRCFWLQSECSYKDVPRRYHQPRPRRVVMSRQPPHVAQPLLRPRPPMQMITLLFVPPWTPMARAFNQPLVAVTPR